MTKLFFQRMLVFPKEYTLYLHVCLKLRLVIGTRFSDTDILA